MAPELRRRLHVRLIGGFTGGELVANVAAATGE